MFLQPAILVALAAVAIIVDAKPFPSTGEFCVTKRASTSHSGSIPATTVTYRHTYPTTKTLTTTVSVVAKPPPATTTITKHVTVTATVTNKQITDTHTTTSTFYKTTTLSSTVTETFSTYTDNYYTTVSDFSFLPVKSTLPTTAGALEKREQKEPRAHHGGSYPASIRCVSYAEIHTTTTKSVTATKTTGTAKQSTITSIVTSTQTTTSTVSLSHAGTTITSTTTSTVSYTPTVTYTYVHTATYTYYQAGPTPNPACGEDNYVSEIGGLRIVDYYVDYIGLYTVEDADREECCNICYVDDLCFYSVYGPFGESGNSCGIYYEYSAHAPCHLTLEEGYSNLINTSAIVQEYNPDGSTPPYYGRYGNYTISNGLCVNFNNVQVLSADCCNSD